MFAHSRTVIVATAFVIGTDSKVVTVVLGAFLPAFKTHCPYQINTVHRFTNIILRFTTIVFSKVACEKDFKFPAS